jgi:arginyl-tRNA synthetase
VFRKEFKQLSESDPESVEYWKMFTSKSIDAMNQVLARLHVKPDFNI